MPISASPIVGTIAFRETGPGPARRVPPDDSSLAALLASLAHFSSLSADDSPFPVRLIASTRLSRSEIDGGGASEVIRADLARLLDDLEHEYSLLTAP